MNIQLSNAGKRFNRDWIFRNINYSFESGKSYAIIGPNGSGKSTLLQIIAASITVSAGAVQYMREEERSIISSDEIYKHIALTAPYLELIEEMTATEFLQFHASFKPLLSGMKINTILEIIGLERAATKQIRFYSSGMKQRLKLAQAIFSNVSILLLDEPCTNLDASGYTLYYQLIKGFCKDKLLIVSSNDINEYNFCDERLSILDYK
jgi:ABC-type multidrug transport system ATPase subunit